MSDSPERDPERFPEPAPPPQGEPGLATPAPAAAAGEASAATAAAPTVAAAPAPATAPPEPSPAVERCFTVQGRTWIARLAGRALGGTGVLANARFEIVHFIPEGEQAPRFQALLTAGRLEHLFEAELAELLWAAQPVQAPGQS